MTPQSRARWEREGGRASQRPAYSGCGLPAPSFMRGRPHPPCFNETDSLPAEACCRRKPILKLS